ncbi:hypothetical protein FMK91_05625 [Klebsiella grimontii]|nr:hypothetical protein [Klebsiella grimontii]
MDARTSIAAAELIPVLNASDAASDGFAAACLLRKIVAQRLRSAMRALFTALLSLRSLSPSSSEASGSSSGSSSEASGSSSGSSSEASGSSSGSSSEASGSSSRLSSSARRALAFLAFLSSSSSDADAPRPRRCAKLNGFFAISGSCFFK